MPATVGAGTDIRMRIPSQEGRSVTGREQSETSRIAKVLPLPTLARPGVMRKLLPCAAGTAVIALAACGPTTSSSSTATPATARAAATAAPKTGASLAGTVTAKAACEALATWENNSSGSIITDTALQQTFQDTTQSLSREFATWVSDARSGSPDASADAALVSLDCTTEGVTVFPSPSPPAAPSSLPPTHSLAGKTVATFSGSGIENTPKFTVTDTWKLSYSFDCSNFGSAGNFQVYEDGGNDFSGVSVNDLAMSKTGSTYAYADGGTHYLEVNSECSWTVKVIDEG
jgi:hypothetical protein